MNTIAPSSILTGSAGPDNPLTVEDIEFRSLSETEWRVSDRRYPADSIQSLLGFVAQQSGRYFATSMTSPREALALPSLEAVAAFFVSVQPAAR